MGKSITQWGADNMYGNGQYGAPPPAPMSQMTMGQVQHYQREVLLPATVGKPGSPQGSSASGSYQINYGTLKQYAPQVLGPNWQDQPFSPENQYKVGEALWNSRVGRTDMSKTWASLPPGTYAGVPWAAIAPIIAQKENAQGGQPPQFAGAHPGMSQAQYSFAQTQVAKIQDEGRKYAGQNNDDMGSPAYTQRMGQFMTGVMTSAPSSVKQMLVQQGIGIVSTVRPSATVHPQGIPRATPPPPPVGPPVSAPMFSGAAAGHAPVRSAIPTGYAPMFSGAPGLGNR